MTISNINLLGKDETIQNTSVNKQKGYQIVEGSVGEIGPGAFFDGAVEKEALGMVGLQEKATGLLQGQSENHAEYLAAFVGEMGTDLLDEHGVSAKDDDIEKVVTVVEKIQLEMAKSGKAQNINVSLSSEEIKAVVGDGAIAYDMADQLKNLTKEDVGYLISNELAPTIGNIYLAQSSSMGEKRYSPLDEEVSRKIEEKVAQYSPKGEYTSVDKELAEWMVRAGVDFTKETFDYAKELLDLKLPMSTEQTDAIIANTLQVGSPASEAMLLPGYDPLVKAENAVQALEASSPEQIVRLMEEGKEINLSNLKELQNKNGKLNQEIIFDKSDLKYISAKRMLEETRLFMTAKANLALLKKGIHIETEQLENLVEELKKQEADLGKVIFDGNEEGEEIFSASKEHLRQFAHAPAYALPKISMSEMTLPQAVENTKETEALLQKANASYETMMTQPRRDLGDSIQSAFRNTGEILEDLGMEVSAGNERAVRILAHNNMPLTVENIQEMRLKDEEVQQLFSNMTPRVVLSMIREGFNPLKASLAELNEKALQLSTELDKSGLDGYGKFLVEMEQRKDISPQEREAYIGIYRLLHQISTTDGAAIGALVKADEEVTMKNLLTQVRNRRASGYERVVDGNRGERTEDFSAQNSISQQIDAAYQAICVQEALKKISVTGLKKASEEELFNQTPQQLLEAFREAEGIQAQQTQAEVAEYISTQEQNMIRQAAMAEKQVLDMLQSLDMPKSPENIVALQQMLTDRNRLFKTVFGNKHKSEELKEAIKEIKEKIWEDMAEALSAPEDMARAQETLAETAEHIMDDMLNDPDMTSLDIRELRRVGAQLQIMRERSKKEEYAVPVMVSDEFGVVSLKIVRGEKKEGKVGITFEGESGTKIAAAFTVVKNAIRGYVVADNEEGLQRLKEADKSLQEQLQKHAGLSGEGTGFAYVVSKDLSLNRFEEGLSQTEGLEAEKDDTQTTVLYGIAKGFLLNLRQISI